MLERLQKIISQAGLASRRDAEHYITDGKVTVNGKVVKELGAKANKDRDVIMVEGKRIRSEKYVYILLNKPKGFVTTASDPEGRKTVLDIITDVKERIYPVGRLDYNTEGLLLLTNDGALTHSLIHPSHKIYKTYIAKVEGVPLEETLDILRAGVRLPEGDKTASAKMHIIDIDQQKNISTIEITIGEGKNRQIRRMFEMIQHPVKNLKRIKFSFLTLIGVKRGQYRHLTMEEIRKLKTLSEKPLISE